MGTEVEEDVARGGADPELGVGEGLSDLRTTTQVGASD